MNDLNSNCADSTHASPHNVLSNITSRIVADTEHLNLSIATLEDRVETRKILLNHSISTLQESVASTSGGIITYAITNVDDSSTMLPDNPDINQTKYHLAQYVGRYPKKTTAALEIVEKEVDYNQTECYCRLVVRNTSTFAIGNLQPFLWLSANRSTRREQQPILSWHLSASAIESNATVNLFLRIRGYVEPECCQLALRWQRRLSNRNDVDQGAAGTTTEHALQTTLEVPWHALSIELVKSAIEIMCTEK